MRNRKLRMDETEEDEAAGQLAKHRGRQEQQEESDERGADSPPPPPQRPPLRLKRRRRRRDGSSPDAREEEQPRMSERESASPAPKRVSPKRRREVIIVRRRRKKRRVEESESQIDPQLDPLGLATPQKRAASDSEARSNPEVTTTDQPRVQLRNRAACEHPESGDERRRRHRGSRQHRSSPEIYSWLRPQEEQDALEGKNLKPPGISLKRRDEVSRRSASGSRSRRVHRQRHRHRESRPRSQGLRRQSDRRQDNRFDSRQRHRHRDDSHRQADSRQPHRHPDSRHRNSDPVHSRRRESPLGKRQGGAPFSAPFREAKDLRLLPRTQVAPIGSGYRGADTSASVPARAPLSAPARLRLRAPAPRFGSGASAIVGRRPGPAPLPNVAQTAAQIRTGLSSTLALLSLAARLKTRFGKGAVTRGPIIETSTKVKSLISGGIAGPLAHRLGSGWDLRLDDDQRRSFVSYLRGAIPFGLTQKWYRELLQTIDWNQPKVGKRVMPRSAAWLTDTDCRCTYRYGGTAWPAHKMKKWFCEITDYVCKACGIVEAPNCCNANLYEDGMQAVGWHADDEDLFQATTDDALIISLSLGAPRIFEVRPKDDPRRVTRMELRDGDICTMEGLMQKNYEHRIPPQRNVNQGRINLTWRWIRSHQRGCPCGSRQAKRPFAAVSSLPIIPPAALQVQAPRLTTPAALPGRGFKRPRLAISAPTASLPLVLKVGNGRLPILPFVPMHQRAPRPVPKAISLRPPLPVIGAAPDEDEAKRLKRAERFKEGAPITTAVGSSSAAGADSRPRPDTERQDRQGLLEVWDPFVHGGWKRHSS